MGNELRRVTEKIVEGNCNCSQCLLQAAEEVYDIKLPEECYDMCKVFSNGLGVGTTCNALEAGLFIFGLLFDHTTCLRLRVKFLTLFQNKFRHLSCHHLKAKLRPDETDCSRIIAETAQIIGQIIEDEQKKA